MSSKRVPIARGSEPSIPVEVGATVGATVGVNLRWEDGTLVTREDLAPEPPAEGLSVTYWRMIREIPANVVALGSTATSGMYVVTGPGTSATRQIESDTLDVVNPAGIAGNPRINMQIRRPAAGAVSALRVVYEDSDGVAHLDPTDDDQVAAMLGLSITAGSGEIIVRTGGTVDDPGWSWSEGFVFAGPDGSLTQTPPVAGWEIVIGYAPSATRINLTFDEPVLLA